MLTCTVQLLLLFLLLSESKQYAGIEMASKMQPFIWMDGPLGVHWLLSLSCLWCAASRVRATEKILSSDLPQTSSYNLSVSTDAPKTPSYNVTISASGETSISKLSFFQRSQSPRELENKEVERQMFVNGTLVRGLFSQDPDYSMMTIDEGTMPKTSANGKNREKDVTTHPGVLALVISLAITLLVLIALFTVVIMCKRRCMLTRTGNKKKSSNYYIAVRPEQPPPYSSEYLHLKANCDLGMRTASPSGAQIMFNKYDTRLSLVSPIPTSPSEDRPGEVLKELSFPTHAEVRVCRESLVGQSMTEDLRNCHLELSNVNVDSHRGIVHRSCGQSVLQYRYHDSSTENRSSPCNYQTFASPEEYSLLVCKPEPIDCDCISCTEVWMKKDDCVISFSDNESSSPEPSRLNNAKIGSSEKNCCSLPFPQEDYNSKQERSEAFNSEDEFASSTISPIAQDIINLNMKGQGSPMSSSVKSNSISSASSTSSSVSMHITVPYEWFSKDSDIGPQNILETYQATATTQTEDWQHSNLGPRPIFCPSWQAFHAFSPAGGTLRLPQSDVRLEVPQGAVPAGSCVDVTAASYTNLLHLRKALQLDEQEVMVSPLAEFGAGGVRFEKNVRISLPHALSPGEDQKCAKVYHVEAGPDGAVKVQPLPFRPRRLDKTRPTINGDSSELQDSCDCDESSPFLQSGIIAAGDSDEADEVDTGFFQFHPDGQLVIYTKHFCGYICTVCQQREPQPMIHMLATARPALKPPRPGRYIDPQHWQVLLRLFLWDRKITIRDFQRDYTGYKIVGENILHLVNDYEDSDVRVELSLCESDDNYLTEVVEGSWRFTTRPKTDTPIFPPVKEFPLRELLCCHAKDVPRYEEWLAERNVCRAERGSCPDNLCDLQCILDVYNIPCTHHHAGFGPGAMQLSPEKSKQVTLFIDMAVNELNYAGEDHSEDIYKRSGLQKTEDNITGPVCENSGQRKSGTGRADLHRAQCTQRSFPMEETMTSPSQQQTQSSDLMRDWQKLTDPALSSHSQLDSTSPKMFIGAERLHDPNPGAHARPNSNHPLEAEPQALQAGLSRRQDPANSQSFSHHRDRSRERPTCNNYADRPNVLWHQENDLNKNCCSPPSDRKPYPAEVGQRSAAGTALNCSLNIPASEERLQRWFNTHIHQEPLNRKSGCSSAQHLGVRSPLFDTAGSLLQEHQSEDHRHRLHEIPARSWLTMSQPILATFHSDAETQSTV